MARTSSQVGSQVSPPPGFIIVVLTHNHSSCPRRICLIKLSQKSVKSRAIRNQVLRLTPIITPVSTATFSCNNFHQKSESRCVDRDGPAVNGPIVYPANQDGEKPFSIYTAREKWAIVIMASIAGTFR